MSGTGFWGAWKNNDWTPKIHSSQAPLESTNRVAQLLDSSGAGTATTEMATTAGTYKIVPPAGSTYYLNRVNIYIEDDAKFQGGYYGGTGALSNGIIVRVSDGSGVLKTLTPQPVKKIGHWGLVAGVDVYMTDFTTGNDIFLIRWTFAKGSAAVKLSGDDGEFLEFITQDNMGAGGAALVSHIAQVQGWKG